MTFPTPSVRQFAQVLDAVDRLDPQQDAAVKMRVRAVCEGEGWAVTDTQIENALTWATPSETEASVSPRGWRRARAVAKELSTVDVPLFLLYGSLMAVAKFSYGAEGLHLFATEKLSSLGMVALSLVLVRTIVAGTLSTARYGTLLGDRWSGIAVPLRLTALTGLLMPLVQGPAGEKISALSALWLSWLS